MDFQSQSTLGYVRRVNSQLKPNDCIVDGTLGLGGMRIVDKRLLRPRAISVIG